MKRLTLSLIALLGALVAPLAIRTATFGSRQLHPQPAPTLQLEQNGAVARLSKAIQFQTVSFDLQAASSVERFPEFHAFLAKSYPRVHAQLTKEIINGSSLLFTW